MTLTLNNGMILQGTVDEIIDYINKTTITYIDNTEDYVKFDNRSISYLKQETQTMEE